jgi:hypothetical protein
MKNVIKYLSFVALLSCSTLLQARESQNVSPRPEPPRTRAGCSQTTATIDLDINNVRARLMNGGDMWWDRGAGVAAYEVPKGDGKVKKNSLFAGSLWIGGKETSTGNTLKMVGQQFRQRGNDYWSGPLDDASGSIDAGVCALWDRFWKINAADVLLFRSFYANLDSVNVRPTILANDAKIAQVIKEWPATGNIFARGAGNVPLSLPSGKSLAPYVDFNKDNKYDYRDGDYPLIVGDQFIWWIFNDNGNVQTETGGTALKIEIQASAFAFATNDCLNDATFYNYKFINKNTSTFDSTYAATWTDADLGWYNDDYIGCDVARGLGILYNADDFDEGAGGYGSDIPMIGMDFFKGPLYAPDPTKPDSLIPLKMRYFTFFNNGAPDPTGDPDGDVQAYNFMTGKWSDGQPFIKNCKAIGTPGEVTNYAFPDDFRECNVCNNPPGDRRFLHSAGPFKLTPGLVSEVTIGAIWVPSVGGNCPSFGKLQVCDDKAQLLFDGGFKLPFGPQAPDLVLKPFDNKFVCYLNNPLGSNNYNEQYGNKDSGSNYVEFSPIAQGVKNSDSIYNFEGYVVLQLKNQNITVSQIRKKDGSIDVDKARIVFQCDKKNGISKIFNFEKDPEISDDFYQARLMVTGADQGIKNNFEITQDAFASGSTKNLVNYKNYYYVVLAYAYNNFENFNTNNGLGQAFQFLESRTDGRKAPLRVYKVTPHPAYDNVYLDTKVNYGDGVELVRIEGKGNGGNNLELTDETVDQILNSSQSYVPFPKYKAGAGPVNVKITDADSIKPGKYTIKLLVGAAAPTTTGDSSFGAIGSSTTWEITREWNGTSQTITGINNLGSLNEQLLAKWGLGNDANSPSEEWGMSVSIGQTQRPGDIPKANGSINSYLPVQEDNGFITSSKTYAEPAKAWLNGIVDGEKNTPNNWIRSGDYVTPTGETTWRGINMDDYNPSNDVAGVFEKVVDGTWAPYFMVNKENNPTGGIGLMYYKGLADRSAANISKAYSVDVVFTSDRSKWTRCTVVETNDGNGSASVPNGNPLSEGGAYKFNIRNHASLLKDADANGNPQYSTVDSGHSWFPGYAINVETGERLNIVFGENSEDFVNNGRDMMFNPTSVAYDPVNGNLKWGGKHFVYISNTRYDAFDGGADWIHTELRKMAGTDPNSGGTNQGVKRSVWATMMWCTPAMKLSSKDLLSWKDGLIPTRTDIKIRVKRPYAQFVTGSNVNNNWPMYQFETGTITPSSLSDAGNQYNNDEDALLDRLNIVPNPYYAYSEYEVTRLDNRVKIINLPEVATIKIYSTDGALIKTIRKADKATTYVEWDLKNEKSVPIASGIYLIHITIKTEQGDKEKVLKWFGIMRPQDITQF